MGVLEAATANALVGIATKEASINGGTSGIENALNQR